MTDSANPISELAGEVITAPGPILILALLSVIAGAAAGFLAAVFRLALSHADRLRDSIILSSHADGVAGLLAIIGISALAIGCAAWLVRRFSPHATGSGIPHVEAQLHARWSGNPLRIIPVKFVGGLLAMGTGLALGREGPSVQMGASLARLLGSVTRRNDDECRALLAAGAGAGLATAFNAPVAGAVFVLEELVRRFDLPTTITTLGASAGAIGIARFLLGQAPDFHVAPIAYAGIWTLPIHLLLGVMTGFLGVGYNLAIVAALRATDQRGRYPVEFGAAAIGCIVGSLAWFVPGIVGGGDAITQRMLNGTEAAFVLLPVFVIRFALGVISYAARTPGGLFAPMLVLGSQSGLFFGTICARWFPSAGTTPTEFAVVGMAALFTAVVRAPLTGIILAIELTGSFTLLLPMLGACFASMLVPTLLQNSPIYDSLRWDPNST